MISLSPGRGVRAHCLSYPRISSRLAAFLTALIGIIIAGALALATMSPAARAAGEPRASDADSDAAKWSIISSRRYHDVLRMTDRVTYTGVENYAAETCDLIADDSNDIITASPSRGMVQLVPYIPYGSDSEEVIRHITEQPELYTLPAPDGASGFGSHLACWNNLSGDGISGLAVAAGSTIYVYQRSDLDSSPQPSWTITLPSPAVALTSLAAGPARTQSSSELAIATSSQVFLLDKDDLYLDTISALDDAHRVWDLPAPAQQVTLAPVGHALGTDGLSVAVGLPGTDEVYVTGFDIASGPLAQRTLKISLASPSQGGSSRLGSALVGLGDLNADGRDDIAIGAPGAHNEAGLVALVNGQPDAARSITVDTRPGTDQPVISQQVALLPDDDDEGEESSAPQDASGDAANDATTDTTPTPAGYVLVQPRQGAFASSLVYLDGADQPGVLVVGRPVSDEHPGAVVISSRALNRNWNAGQGILGIDETMMTTLAFEEDASGDGGTTMGLIPPAHGRHLQGLMMGDTKAQAYLSTFDLSRQDDPRIDAPTTVTPAYPMPEEPAREPGVEVVDSAERKVWLGEFSSGFAGSLAGQCDVTGDGRPDLITGNPVRSHWVYDPLLC